MDKDTRTGADSRTSNPGLTITSLLLSGMLFYGGLGWLVDRWVGTTGVFLPIGIVLGLVGALYLVYVRFGRDQ